MKFILHNVISLQIFRLFKWDLNLLPVYVNIYTFWLTMIQFQRLTQIGTHCQNFLLFFKLKNKVSNMAQYSVHHDDALLKIHLLKRNINNQYYNFVCCNHTNYFCFEILHLVQHWRLYNQFTYLITSNWLWVCLDGIS